MQKTIAISLQLVKLFHGNNVQRFLCGLPDENSDAPDAFGRVAGIAVQLVGGLGPPDFNTVVGAVVD